MFSASKSGQYQGYQISRSVRIRGSASAFLNRTPSTTTNRRTFVWSGWAKLGALDGALRTLFGSQDNNAASGNLLSIYLSSNAINVAEYSSSYRILIASTQVFRDPSAWYHFVVAIDTTQTTASNRVKIYVNGLQITAFSTATYPAQNTDLFMNVASQPIGIGARLNTAGNLYFYDGYLTEVNFIDGYPTGVTQGTWAAFWGTTCPLFGVTNAYGVWSPIKYNGTYGTNGFYLNFSDNSAATAAAIGADSSGNGNNFTPNNISVTAGATYDSMLDVPTPWGDGGNGRGNYAVLNPLDTFSSSTLSRANLQQAAALGGYRSNATIRVPASGKWYAEFINSSAWSASIGLGFGVSTEAVALNGGSGASGSYHFYASGVAAIVNNGSATTISSITNSANQTFQLAVDVDNGKVWIGQNNTWYNSSGGSTGDPSTGANPSFTISPAGFKIFTYIDSNSTVNWNANFGQRPFAYTPPTGFNALNTFNLPEPSIDDGRLYMAATTYTGTGASLSVNNTVNNASFQPDFVWVKGRSGATDHALYDAVRGVQKQIESNTTTAETTETTGLTAFNSNGFTVGALAQMNTNTATYVGWQWNAGGSNATNTSGTITSTVRASTTAGFSIVTYTGTGANATVGHGLGVAPSMIIVKQRSGVNDWPVYHANQNATPQNGLVYLNATNAYAAAANVWNSTAPTSSVFSIGTNGAVNGNTATYVAYCFAPITGFSAFGSYTGNGSADGPFVFCGFRPRWIMTKLSSAAGGGWWIYDTARDPYNATNDLLQANLANASATSLPFDILSNGFKIRTSNVGANTNAATYIFAAFAENPFKYSLAR